MNSVLRTGEANGELSDRVNDSILEMREHIDRLSSTLLNEGLVDGRLRSKIASNIGVYLHRAYRVNFDPSWVRGTGSSIPVEVMNNAKSFIRDRFKEAEGRTLSEREVNNIIDDLLLRDDAQKSILLDEEFRGVDLTILRDRKGVPPPIKALLGEIKSPVFNYLNTTHRLAKLVSEQQALRAMKQVGLGTFFYEEGDFNHPTGYNHTIEGGPADLLHPLRGLKTHKDILDAINNALVCL